MTSTVMSASDFHLGNLEGSTPELHDSIQNGDQGTHDFNGDYSGTQKAIWHELAAKAELLLFLDERTSGLDSLEPEPPLDAAQVPRDPSHYGITV